MLQVRRELSNACKVVRGGTRCVPCFASEAPLLHTVSVSQRHTGRVGGPRAHRQALAGPPRLGRIARPFSTKAGPLVEYKALLEKGKITRDARQEKVMELLQKLADKVVLYTPPATNAKPRIPAQSAKPAGGGGGGGGFFEKFFGRPKQPAPKKPAKPQVEKLNIPAGVERGLYIWGGTGSGKTFMMDLFHATVPVKKKRRIHFNEWMIEVHEKLHRLQKANAMVRSKANTVWTAESAKAQRESLKAKGFDGTHGKTTGGGDGAQDLVAQVAQEMMDEAWLLCFDEFQVTHISDAIIMKRLFSILFEKGCIVVATSNRPPEDLYLNGLNRNLFMPFIPMLKDRCQVHDIDSAVDYRLLSNAEDDDRRVYITPADSSPEAADEAFRRLERKFWRICRNQVNQSSFLETQGRRIAVGRDGKNSNVGWFNFKDLCDKPLGAADYIAIARAFHTIFVANVPKLTMQERDQVRRMITMIDCFYEKGVKLVCAAPEQPMSLFELKEEEKQNSTFDEVFAWDRTVSRLVEMQSVDYLSKWIKEIEADQLLAQYDLVSLSADDIAELWTRYDVDNSHYLDFQECVTMLQDVMEATQGHRHVSEDLADLVFGEMDVDKGGTVDRTEFEEHLKKHGLTLHRSSVNEPI